MIRTRCYGLVGAMIPSRLCCMRRFAHTKGEEISVRR